MSVEVCSVANEAEAEAIRLLLKDHEIEAQVVRLESSAYPGVSYHPSWGVIRVAEENVERARGLVCEWENAQPVEGDDASEPEEAAQPGEPDDAGDRRDHVLGPFRKAWPMAKAILFVGSLALNAFLIVKYVWHPHRSVHVVEDSAGRPEARFFYRPWDRYPHQTDTFLTNGLVDASFFDENADGRHELMQIYDHGQLVYEGRDTDENGTYEHLIEYAGGKKTVESWDRDQNKRPEESTYFVDGKPRAWTRDVDVDGFSEIVSCTAADGTVHERKLAPCDL